MAQPTLNRTRIVNTERGQRITFRVAAFMNFNDNDMHLILIKSSCAFMFLFWLREAHRNQLNYK